MFTFLQDPSARLVLWLALLAIMTVIGVYLVRRFRDGAEQTETASELLAKFREMHDEGYLNDSEFRTIKTDLNAKLSEQLRRAKERQD
jgi:hypothetical protein